MGAEGIGFALVVMLFFTAAALYASVGMGGGSSYTAFLAMYGVSAAQIASTAPALNLIVPGRNLVPWRRRMNGFAAR